MRFGGSVRVAAFTAAAFLMFGAWLPAGAGDDDDPHAMLFSGRDIWRNGVFAYGGFLIAPGGFEQDGIMLKLLLSGGLYRYNAGSLGGEQVIGSEWAMQMLPGFRIKRGDAEIKFFFGPEWQHHRLWPDDSENRLRGQSYALRMASELWYEPTRTTLIAADAALSSRVTSHSARLAFGWRVADEIFNGDGFYLGPEAQYFGSDGYKQGRLGLHITSMKTEATEWSAGGGWAKDTDGRSSPYVRLGVSSKL
jgi:hypothetical protein